ncbi:ABC transporter ATP-binding protein/permease [Clostridium swellfunianum]|uniref:ABC transporter ATP-binding protein n=1 Tax=Clostridium swellfunianum TaxID=1367462 RepID=UPI00203087FB|nr:ABC transporter ATP-binding protein [Clostridium swellfunianum]MCM0648179.1 ABC transporter ATP-binding protein/permease [Clostridium swellfunianum]
MGNYKKYVKTYWKPFCIALSFLMLEAIADLLQPTIMSKIIDVGVKGKDLNYVLKMGGLMLLVTGFGAISAVTRNIVSSNVSQKFGAELRLDLYKRVQSMSFDNIDRFEAASLVTRLTNDVTQLQNFVHGMMRIFVKAPIVCIGSIIMATLLNPRMAVIIFSIVPIVAVLISLSMKIGYPYFTKVQKALDKVNAVIREYLSGVRVVKAFNRFDYETERFENANEGLTAQSTKAMRVMAVFNPGITLTVNLGIVVLMWLGGSRVNSGQVEVGQIIAFLNYMTQILFTLIMISNVFTMFIRAKASAERIGEVFNEESTIKEAAETENVKNLKGRVDFENISFSYSGASGEPVLKNISFSCLPGETVGIIGSTGSGKSSLVNLVPRFYDTASGSVKLNGIEVKNLSLKELRDKIALVPQKTMLFTGSIIDNIRWGKEAASEEEVAEAAKIAQAHDFISKFPEGYNTQLGQGGVNLSGGQKQRLSIARALIKRPEVLILDDCTSAVDVTTETKIREGLKKYSKDLTTIIIAQRITSVMNADKIIVLDNGQIASMGKHEELLKASKVYQDIFRSQIGKELMQNV